MFKQIFLDLCIKKGEAPTAVCKKIGLSNAAYSQWTDESVPHRTTLKKIADYFGVTPEYFTGAITDENGFATPVLTADKQELLMLYDEIGDTMGITGQKGLLTYMRFLIENSKPN